MTQEKLGRPRTGKGWFAGLVAAWLLALPATGAWADAAELRARHEQLRAQLADNPFGRAMHVDSMAEGNTLRGDIHAVLDHPYERVRDALKEPAAWCDVLILPFNTKACVAATEAGQERLLLRIGRKHDQPIEQAFQLELAFANLAAGSDFLDSRLQAREGPFGTRDYDIRIQAVPLGPDRTFMHLSYSYGFGAAGKLAMQAYLATVGADKVGFTVTGRAADGVPQYIGGVRGAVERNAMRYYLAIDAYLDSLAAPPAQQVDRRIQRWFAATEKYPRQLREMDRASYVAMKRSEVERQQALALK